MLIHFRLTAVCLFVLFHHKVRLGIFIRILQTCCIFDNALPVPLLSQPFCVSLIVFPASHPPLTFLLQSISVLPACDKRGSKVPATIKCSEMKMLPQRVLRLMTLMEPSPLAGLAEAPRFPKTGAQFSCIQ